MNYLLLALAAAAAVPAAAQTTTVAAPLLPADSLTHRIKFSGVVPVPGVPAAELHARARQWVALTFEDAHQVTQLTDEARGVLIGRGYTLVWRDVKPSGTGGYSKLIAFTFRLDFREGRYRYELTDLSSPLYPAGSEGNNNPYAISATASQQAREQSAWQLGATATLAASPRRSLLQPEHVSLPREYDLAASVGRGWPAYSADLNTAITQLLDSLRRYETAAPARW